MLEFATLLNSIIYLLRHVSLLHVVVNKGSTHVFIERRRRLTELNVCTLDEFLNVHGCALGQFTEPFQEDFGVFALQNDAEDELNEDEQHVDILILDKPANFDLIRSKGPHLAHRLNIRLEPLLHLLEHALVDLSEDFGVVLSR